MPKFKFNLDPKRTHPLVWLGAIICTILAIAVIFTGLVVFIGYMIIHPKVPYITVTAARLDKLDYDQVGQMDTQISILIKAENDNAKAHASFSDMSFLLYFDGIRIAKLTADPFDVPKNSSISLQYVVPSSSIPLTESARNEIDISLKRNKIIFHLIGEVKTRWRVGVVGSVKFWSHMTCELQFFRSNGTSIRHHCSSRSN